MSTPYPTGTAFFYLLREIKTAVLSRVKGQNRQALFKRVHPFEQANAITEALAVNSLLLRTVNGIRCFLKLAHQPVIIPQLVFDFIKQLIIFRLLLLISLPLLACQLFLSRAEAAARLYKRVDKFVSHKAPPSYCYSFAYDMASLYY